MRGARNLPLLLFLLPSRPPALLRLTFCSAFAGRDKSVWIWELQVDGDFECAAVLQVRWARGAALSGVGWIPCTHVPTRVEVPQLPQQPQIAQLRRLQVCACPRSGGSARPALRSHVSRHRLRPTQGHTQDVKAVAWHPDGDRLVSCSYDDALRVWEPDIDGDDWHCAQTISRETCGEV